MSALQSVPEKCLIVFALMFPVSVIGNFTFAALNRCLGALGALSLTAAVMLIVTFVSYFFVTSSLPRPSKTVI